MSPCYSYLCHGCMYEFDSIDNLDSPRSVDCPRCEEPRGAHRIIAAPSSPRGSFGTAPRRSKDKTAEFNFDKKGE